MRVLALVSSLLLFSSSVAAQDVAEDLGAKKVDDKIAPPAEDEEQGWKLEASVAANFSYNRTDNVVGTLDGDTIQAGAQVNSTANYVSGDHHWENSLSFVFTQSRTPALDVFVKAADELKLDTVYLYRISPWWGPFAEGTFTTAVARGFDVRPEQVRIERTFRDGSTSGELLKEGGETYRLTDPFEPITLSEIAGIYAIASDTELLNARFKLGMGGEQVFAGTGFVIDDDDTTADVIEYTQLQSSNQLGAVLDGSFSGTLAENITYSAKARVFYAGISDYEVVTGVDESRDLEGSELFSVQVDAKLSAKLSDWASLDYVFIYRRIPWVTLANQITNGVIVSLTYDLI